MPAALHLRSSSFIAWAVNANDGDMPHALFAVANLGGGFVAVEFQASGSPSISSHIVRLPRGYSRATLLTASTWKPIFLERAGRDFSLTALSSANRIRRFFPPSGAPWPCRVRSD